MLCKIIRTFIYSAKANTRCTVHFDTTLTMWSSSIVERWTTTPYANILHSGNHGMFKIKARMRAKRANETHAVDTLDYTSWIKVNIKTLLKALKLNFFTGLAFLRNATSKTTAARLPWVADDNLPTPPTFRLLDFMCYCYVWIPTTYFMLLGLSPMGLLPLPIMAGIVMGQLLVFTSMARILICG